MGEEKQYFFDLKKMASEFPTTADVMFKDIRMTSGIAASCRLVRMYKPLPLHFHKVSDENVYVFCGRALFQIGGELRVISPGMFIQFPKGTLHAVLQIFEEPLLTLTVDTPCRPENDVTYVGTGSHD